MNALLSGLIMSMFNNTLSHTINKKIHLMATTWIDDESEIKLFTKLSHYQGLNKIKNIFKSYASFIMQNNVLLVKKCLLEMI